VRPRFANLHYFIKPLEDWEHAGGLGFGGAIARTRADADRDYVTEARREAARIARMVDALPDVIFAAESSETMSQAGAECFFAHIRTLIEFLEVKPTRHRNDMRARDTLGDTSTWPPQLTDTLRATLRGYWKLASEHLAHFSKARPKELAINRTELNRIADDVLSVWDKYADESNDTLVPHRANFSIWGNG
jgi:hypothetical protein